MGAVNPYANTKVPSETTQIQIQNMLKKFKYGSSRWTNYSEEDAGKILGYEYHEVICLEFGAKIDTEKGEKDVGVRILVPVPIDSEDERVNKRVKNQRMRALYWWIKAKLESVSFEFMTFEKEFLPFIVTEGGSTVFQLLGGDEISGKLEHLPAANVLALPEKVD